MDPGVQASHPQRSPGTGADHLASGLSQRLARMEIAWSASVRPQRTGAGYASRVLWLSVEWDASSGDSRCRAFVDEGGEVRAVGVPGGPAVTVHRRGCWTHVDVDGAGGAPLVSAVFESDRLCYCRSSAPEAAGMPGGSYGAPTAILELYAAEDR